MSFDVVVRTEFSKHKLLESDLAAEPFTQFQRWLDDVQAENVSDWQAMSLATATGDGRPSVRIVYLRGWDERGFLFYTNFDSRKGHELADNPRAAAVLHWKELERQVRIEGAVVRASDAEADAYFAGRPRESCIGAWASAQSQPLSDRATLKRTTAECEAKFAGGPIPRPPNWGGFRIVPESVEFWQGGVARLHDRLIYRRQADDSWRIERLFP
ncbi:MAG: pyridoxamine 5'-phosphate oxidase [Planctomycetota bacterium]|jgi:pyridoxamine 5'-phosphate oxidase|nr:MAG: pyridoxamine 5'-phosphate oxidase [Planctomycetota bacterium]GDY10545.1 pyridoxine/pyridoxamine 5'-phosphate oxidase [Planctomycetia bacterium]